MNQPILLARIEPAEGGAVRVLAPAVGWWSDAPHTGALLGPGSRIGRLEQLHRRWRLVLPEGAAGRLSGGLPRDRSVAVEYGQTLFELVPVSGALDTSLGEDSAVLGRPAHAGLPEGAHAVVSPTDGVFYRRPTPEAPPFVDAGARIRAGQPVGLVEVMKTFNRILYGGPGLPDEAEVIEIRCADGAEVQAGQILVVLR